MRKIALLLALLSTAAFGQGYSASGAGVTLTTSQTISGAKTFSATLALTDPTTGASLITNSKLQFASTGAYLYGDGNGILMAGLYFVLTNADLYLRTSILNDAGANGGMVLINDAQGTCIGDGTGTTCDGTITAATVMAGVQSFTGNTANFSNGLTSLSTTTLFGLLTQFAQTVSIAEANGASPATQTITPTANVVLCTCNDANGCTITMGETAMVSGIEVTIVSTTATACTFADTAGVTELTGAISLGQWDSLKLVYITDRWVQVTTSNN